ncbi:hemagglutinin repeat-containing protein [Orbus wheelerorum]|uniref:hemagglutinin repeat-containing protein n=1 Tax=Orbus wheelerorum TaxID=3074111 RepID=UPI00370DACC4
MKGSEVKTGQDISLDAGHDLTMLGAVNTQHSDKDEKSYGGGVGISFTVGGDQTGLRFTGNANFSRERENADGSAWSEGIVDAGKNLTVKTGNNTSLVGAQLKGDSVKLDVGHNLNIESLQDSDYYDYDKITASVNGSFGTGFSGNLALSQTKMDSNWASVTDQSGIFAGKNGFDVTVGNNTDLKGAVIASTAEDKSNNKLDTGTISFSDIENKADFDVSHVSVSIGTSGTSPTAGMPSIYHNSDSASSTTKSAVEDGKLIVRNQDEQKQNIDELSRNTENANNPLGQIFDKQKEQDRMDAIDLVRDIVVQGKNLGQKYSKIEAQLELKAQGGVSDKQKDEAIEALNRHQKRFIIIRSINWCRKMALVVWAMALAKGLMRPVPLLSALLVAILPVG